MMEKIEKTIYQKEDELDSLLEQFPKELRGKWEKIVEGMDDIDQALNTMRQAISERNRVIRKSFEEVMEIKDLTIKQEVVMVLESIDSTFGDETYFIGEGTVGKVYSMPYAPHVCVKYITDKDMLQKHGNTVRQEIEYLIELDDFVVGNIQAPQVLFNYKSQVIEAFGMKTIDGLSLDKIIADRNSCDFLEVIRKQDVKDVVKNMKDFITKMHEEKKIVHRDLAPRNIMVDRNGVWYVIDFGKSKKIEIGDSSTELSQQSDFASAENAIRVLFSKMY